MNKTTVLQATFCVICGILLAVMLIMLAVASDKEMKHVIADRDAATKGMPKLTAEESLEVGCYPWRAADGYDDLVFDYAGFLEMGAVDAKITKHEFGDEECNFLATGTSVKAAVETTVFEAPNYTVTLLNYSWGDGICVSRLLVEMPDGTAYRTELYGSSTGARVFGYGKNCPVATDRKVFDVLHVLLLEDPCFYYGEAEGGCPLRALGLIHTQYSKEDQEWVDHNDAGGERYDLHF